MIHKEFLQLNNKKELNLNMGKGLSRHFSKEDIQMANKHIERFSTLLILGKYKLKPQGDNH